MNAKIQKRRFKGFRGSNTDYINFLEKRVGRLEEQLHTLGQQLGTTVSAPEKGGKLSPNSAKKSTDSFSKKLPKDENEWARIRKLLHFQDIRGIIHTFLFLTRVRSEPHSLNLRQRPDREANILDILGDYHVFAKALVGNKTYATQMSNYSTIIFLGISIVALWARFNIDAVDLHIREFLTAKQGKKCEASGTYLSQLRTAALWPIIQMEKLYQEGLKHRAWELFLHRGPSIHSYRKFIQDPESKAFTEDVDICEPPIGEVQADVPLSIPFLIKFILGESLDVINGALGTNLRQQKYDEWVYTVNMRRESLQINSLTDKNALQAQQENEGNSCANNRPSRDRTIDTSPCHQSMDVNLCEQSVNDTTGNPLVQSNITGPIFISMISNPDSIYLPVLDEWSSLLECE